MTQCTLTLWNVLHLINDDLLLYIYEKLISTCLLYRPIFNGLKKSKKTKCCTLHPRTNTVLAQFVNFLVIAGIEMVLLFIKRFSAVSLSHHSLWKTCPERRNGGIARLSDVTKWELSACQKTVVDISMWKAKIHRQNDREEETFNAVLHTVQTFKSVVVSQTLKLEKNIKKLLKKTDSLCRCSSLICWSIAVFLWAITATCRRVEQCETTVHHWHASAACEKTAPYRAHPKRSLQRITIKTWVGVSPIHLTKEWESWLHAELLVEQKLWFM